MNIIQSYYILELNLGLENDIAILKAKNIPYKLAQGSYKGVISDCYIIPAKYKHDIEKLAKIYDQESILFVDSNGQASLIYTESSKEVFLGQMRQVYTTQDLEAWTKVDGVYLTA